MDEPESGKWEMRINSDYEITIDELETMTFITRVKQDDSEASILFYPESEKEGRMKWIMMASCRIR